MTGEGLNSGGCLLFGLVSLGGRGQLKPAEAREKKKSINFERVFLYNAGEARSHGAISRTIWTHNVVLQ